MPTFLYRAVDLASRAPVEGAIDAESDREARAALHARGIMPLSIGPAAPEGTLDSAELKAFWEAVNYRRVKPAELLIFTQQLAALLEAGMPIVEAMVLLEAQTSSATLREAVAEVRKDLMGGLMLSEAMARRPREFPPLLVQLAAAGELSGDLGLMISRMAETLEKQLEVTRKVQTAMLYPAVVASTLSAVVLVLLAFVVPAFTGIYAKAGAALPIATRLLLAVSEAVRAGWPLMLAGAIAATLAYRAYGRTPVGRERIDGFWLSVPGIGPLLLSQAANTFTRAFGTVYGAGVAIVPALEGCIPLVGNRAIVLTLERALRQVQTGSTLASGLENTAHFPPVLAQMMAIGEATGRLEELTAKAVIYSDKEIDFRVKQMTGMIEPLLTLVMGLIVMFIAFALYLPLFDLPKLMMGK